jgi:hypothetical protein
MVSQVEAKMIASTNHNYIVPTSSSPLRGLIQVGRQADPSVALQTLVLQYGTGTLGP